MHTVEFLVANGADISSKDNDGVRMSLLTVNKSLVLGFVFRYSGKNPAMFIHADIYNQSHYKFINIP